MNEQIQQYAGFWRRFAAYVIDRAVLAFALIGLANVLGAQMVAQIKDYDTITLTIAIYISLMSILLSWTYFSGMESSPLQATIGKLAVGVYVTDLQGQRISFGRASGRFFGKLLSGAILLIGYLMAGFAEKKQALHDMMAGCLVLWK